LQIYYFKVKDKPSLPDLIGGLIDMISPSLVTIVVVDVMELKNASLFLRASLMSVSAC